jgi:hypothetical protein
MELKEDKSRSHQNQMIKILYPDHSPFETIIWISGWCFAVIYGINNTYPELEGHIYFWDYNTVEAA